MHGHPDRPLAGLDPALRKRLPLGDAQRRPLAGRPSHEHRRDPRLPQQLRLAVDGLDVEPAVGVKRRVAGGDESGQRSRHGAAPGGFDFRRMEALDFEDPPPPGEGTSLQFTRPRRPENARWRDAPSGSCGPGRFYASERFFLLDRTSIPVVLRSSGSPSIRTTLGFVRLHVGARVPARPVSRDWVRLPRTPDWIPPSRYPRTSSCRNRDWL